MYLLGHWEVLSMQVTSKLMKHRLTITLLVVSFAFLLLIVKLFWIEFVHGSELRKAAEGIDIREVSFDAKRGTIYDRNGNTLVTSMSVYSIYANPNQIMEQKHPHPRQEAKQLANLLGLSENDLYKQLINENSSFVWLKRKVDSQIADQIRSLDLTGIGFVEESKRFSTSDLASHLLGFTGIDNQGLLGIEKSFDDELKGEPGLIVAVHDASGRPIPEEVHQFIPAQPGADLVLTLDQTIQYFVDKELDNAVNQYHPKYAFAIVMDPQTGGILAMGSRPTFDPNNWSKSPQQVWDKNPAIWYNYEPGSTFKIITSAAAMEEGTVHANDMFYVPSAVKVSGCIIHNSDGRALGTVPFKTVLADSSNVGFVKVGFDLGKEKLYKYLKAFGIGQPTGIDLPGEASGIVIPEKTATKLNLATIAMGQSIAVTPIQLLTAVSAVANDGMLMKPMLVKELREDGQTVKEFQPQQVRQVISPGTAKELCLLLENVVTSGTGGNAVVSGYRVGGKTGTAQVVSEKGGYVPGSYVASFLGLAPVENPRVTVLVVVAEPKGGNYYGGLVAAPIFQSICENTLHYLGVPENPALNKSKPQAVQPAQPVEANIKVPNVENYSRNQAVDVINAARLQCQTSGAGNLVVSQSPKGGAAVRKGTTINLQLSAAVQPDQGKLVKMPAMQGLTIKKAGILLADIGVSLVPEGTGKAISQSVKPGSLISRGTSVRVRFAP